MTGKSPTVRMYTLLHLFALSSLIIIKSALVIDRRMLTSARCSLLRSRTDRKQLPLRINWIVHIANLIFMSFVTLVNVLCSHLRALTDLFSSIYNLRVGHAEVSFCHNKHRKHHCRSPSVDVQIVLSTLSIYLILPYNL